MSVQAGLPVGGRGAVSESLCPAARLLPGRGVSDSPRTWSRVQVKYQFMLILLHVSYKVTESEVELIHDSAAPSSASVRSLSLSNFWLVQFTVDPETRALTKR